MSTFRVDAIMPQSLVDACNLEYLLKDGRVRAARRCGEMSYELLLHL